MHLVPCNNNNNRILDEEGGVPDIKVILTANVNRQRYCTNSTSTQFVRFHFGNIMFYFIYI
jgi:hypothetical protein